MSSGNGNGTAVAAAPRPEGDPQRPVHEVRIGTVKAAIWAGEGRYGRRHAVTVCKLYKSPRDGGERWRTTEVFDPGDLLPLAKVIDLAHTWVCEREKGPEVPF